MSAGDLLGDAVIPLILSPSGLLHLARCGLRRGGYAFTLSSAQELLGFLYLDFRGFCRRCLGETA